LVSGDLISGTLSDFNNSKGKRIQRPYAGSDQVYFTKNSEDNVYEFVNSVLVSKNAYKPRSRNDESLKKPLVISNEIPERFKSASKYFQSSNFHTSDKKQAFRSTGELINNLNTHLGDNLAGYMLITGAHSILASHNGHIYKSQLESFGEFIKQDDGTFLKLLGYKNHSKK
jgi:hypothetical protein